MKEKLKEMLKEKINTEKEINKIVKIKSKVILKEEMDKHKLKRAKILKKVIKNELGTDISKTCRVRQVVENRNIYYLILRETEHNTFQFIADTINKSHATIINGVKRLKDWMLYDASLKERYNKVLQLYYTKLYNKEIAYKLTTVKELPVINGATIPYTFLNIVIKVPEYKKAELKGKIEDFLEVIKKAPI